MGSPWSQVQEGQEHGVGRADDRMRVADGTRSGAGEERGLGAEGRCPGGPAAAPRSCSSGEATGVCPLLIVTNARDGERVLCDAVWATVLIAA